MRQQFILNGAAASDHHGPASIGVARCEPEVWEICPWAAEVIECEGGWMAFESAPEAVTWLRQTWQT
jgi:hypothetical protein